MQKSNDVIISCNHVGVFYPNSHSIFSSRSTTSGFWALKDLNFELKRGDILGLIGKNGAGKSTALSVINRIIEPDQGKLETYNHSSMLLSINAGLSQNLSGKKNIYLIGLTLGLTKEIIDEKINEIIEFTDLGEFIDKPVDTYSSGMKLRLGFSTALFLEPTILLVDEALGVGDKDFRKKSSEALKQKLSGNTTAIIVSHNEKTIQELCTHVMIMEHGKSIIFGTPDEMLKIYSTM